MSQKERLFALKGDFAARPYGSTGPYKPLFNATDAKLAMSIETIKQKSNGNTSGTIAEDEVDREAAFEVTLQSRDKENLKRYLYAKSREVAAATDPIAFTLPVGEVGDIVDLRHQNVTDLAFGSIDPETEVQTGLIEGIDYRALADVGTVEYLKAVAAPAPGTFKHSGYTEYGIFSEDAIELEILFTSVKAGHTYELYRLKLSPAESYQLVSDGNEYATQPLKGTLLINPTATADPILGKFGRLRAAK